MFKIGDEVYTQENEVSIPPYHHSVIEGIFPPGSNYDNRETWYWVHIYDVTKAFMLESELKLVPIDEE